MPVGCRSGVDQTDERVDVGVEALGGPLGDLGLLGEHDHLVVAADLLQPLENLERAFGVGVHGGVVKVESDLAGWGHYLESMMYCSSYP